MLFALLLATELAAQTPVVPPVRELAIGVHLQPGGFELGRGPEGNTIVFDAPDGLVVVDTGRHAWHSDAILAYARGRGRPIAAIVNTHWHLDHSSGNGRLKTVYLEAHVYTTSAIDRVIAPGGFLTRNLEDAQHAERSRCFRRATRRGADISRHHGAPSIAAPRCRA